MALPRTTASVYVAPSNRALAEEEIGGQEVLREPLRLEAACSGGT